MSIARALAKLGLVELSDAEKKKIKKDAQPAMSAAEIAELARGGPGAKAAAKSAQGKSTTKGKARSTAGAKGGKKLAASSEIDDSLSFDEIYAGAGVPDSPFAADKLVKLLDGLKSLPTDVRKQAVMAMDAAEDSWTVSDSLIDAKRKTDALTAEKSNLAEQLQQIDARAQAALADKEEYGKRATAEIRQQIADLELMLEQELGKTAAECEAVKRSALDAKKAFDRASQRYDEEISGLMELGRIFGQD